MLCHQMWGTAHSKTQCNLPEDFHLQQYIIISTINIIILELGRIRQLRQIPWFPRRFGLFISILVILKPCFSMVRIVYLCDLFKTPQCCWCWLPCSRVGVKPQMKTGNISKYVTVYTALSLLHWQAYQLSHIIWYFIITSVKTV